MIKVCPMTTGIVAASLFLSLNVAIAAPTGSAASSMELSTPSSVRDLTPVNKDMPPVTKILPFSLTCRAQGSPVEFPNDIALINNGPGPVPSGTRVRWNMAAPNYSGTYTFTEALAKGKAVFIPDVLGSGVQAMKSCTVTVNK